MSSKIKINQFVSVTGATVDTARSLLNACEGNVELAIGMYMEGGGTSLASNKERVEVPIPDEDDVRPPILPVRSVLVENEPTVGRLRRRKRNLPPSIFDPFRDVASEMHSIPGGNDSKKRAALSHLFRPPLDLMFQGNFTEAKEAGSTVMKWLLVNVQDSREFSSQLLNRDVWNNGRVKNVVQNNFLLWQAYRGTDEATKFCQFYTVYSFPFVAVVDPRTGELLDHWKGVTSESFLEFASDFLSSHSLSSDGVGIPQPKKSRIGDDVAAASVIDLSEEEQLQAAITASISQNINGGNISDNSDTDDFVLVDSDEDNKDSDIKESLQSDSIKQPKGDISSTLDSSRLAYLNMARKLPSDSVNSEQAKGKGSVRRNTEKSLPMQKLSISDRNDNECVSSGCDIHLLLRLPSGARVECNFKENHPVQELFDVLSAQDYDVEEVEIIANFPRRVITMVNCLQSFKDVGLKSRETVFVQTR